MYCGAAKAISARKDQGVCTSFSASAARHAPSITSARPPSLQSRLRTVDRHSTAFHGQWSSSCIGMPTFRGPRHMVYNLHRTDPNPNCELS